MRIAFIDYFPTHYRRRLYEEIGRRSDADFFFYSTQQERWADPRIPAVWEGDYRRVDLPSYRVAGESLMPGVVRRIARGDYDTVIKSTNGRLMLPLVYHAATVGKANFVLWSGMWIHPDSPFHRLSRRPTEAIYRGAGAIVVYGDHVRDFILRTRGVTPDKLFVAGQAVDGTLYERTAPDWEGRRPEVLYVGQLKEFKGIRYLLDAFSQLGDTAARLRIVGGGVLSDWITERASTVDNVELVGYRSQTELPRELARARCLVLPSITTRVDKEPWGLVVNEAMHSGVPVVATDAVGAAAGGLVVDGRNGFIVPERDSVALSSALRRLIEEPELAARMGAAAREDVRRFNYDRMADAFIAAAQYAAAAQRRR